MAPSKETHGRVQEEREDGADLMTAGGIAAEEAHMAQPEGSPRMLNHRVGEDDDPEPAPVTPPLDMAFTSSSMSPIAPPIGFRAA